MLTARFLESLGFGFGLGLQLESSRLGYRSGVRGQGLGFRVGVAGKHLVALRFAVKGAAVHRQSRERQGSRTKRNGTRQRFSEKEARYLGSLPEIA